MGAARRRADSELRVEIKESARGRDIYVIQPTSPPVDSHLMELLFLAHACRAGAHRITAAIPYFGWCITTARCVPSPAAAR